MRLTSQISQKTSKVAVFKIGKDGAALDASSEELDLEKWFRHTIIGAKSEGIRLKSFGIVF